MESCLLGGMGHGAGDRIEPLSGRPARWRPRAVCDSRQTNSQMDVAHRGILMRGAGCIFAGCSSAAGLPALDFCVALPDESRTSRGDRRRAAREGQNRTRDHVGGRVPSVFHAFPNYIQLIGPALLNLECGGKVLRDAAFLPDRDSITSQSGVAEYLASALQIKTPLSASTGSALAGDVLSSRRLSGAAQMDASITAALTLGFVLGLRHALDPDHLVAVSTIVSEHKSVARSSLVGTFWGLGHTSSLLAISLV